MKENIWVTILGQTAAIFIALITLLHNTYGAEVDRLRERLAVIEKRNAIVETILEQESARIELTSKIIRDLYINNCSPQIPQK